MAKSTKELARELGLLKKRKRVNRLSASTSTGQPFKYLIVIDFESTCWENAKFRTQEIIEFPAVLLNIQTGVIESEFHHYIQPQEQPILSNFCTELTGITQDQVNDGIPINLCLRRFCHWLNKLNSEKGVVCHGTVCESGIPVNTTCVTWSDWDLGVCLQYECKRKQLLKPVQLNVWIDLRATYRRFYDRKPNGLNGALQDLGIEFQGREHSGVDDARNTSKLAYRMIQDGCVMKNTRNMKDHTRSVSLPTTILLTTRKTPPRKAKEKKGFVNSPTDKRLKLEAKQHDNLCHTGGNSTKSSSNVKEKESFEKKDVVALRTTPPRKAKEKAVPQNSTVCTSDTNSKSASDTNSKSTSDTNSKSTSDTNSKSKDFIVKDSSTRDTPRTKISTIETNGLNSLNCDCVNICLCEDLEQFLADCDNVSSIPMYDNVSSSDIGKRFQKRKLTSEKKGLSCSNSPARKLPRHVSPRFSFSDIYVDPDDGRNNSINKVVVPTDGLKYRNTNITSKNNETSALGPCESSHFKKPICGSRKTSISSFSGQHKTFNSLTGGDQMQVSGQFNSSKSG